MIAKSLAAAAIATTLAAALPAGQAEAKTTVNIGVGFGDFYPGYGYGYGYYPVYNVYDDAISCKQGRKIVSWSGFNNVKPVDCSLPRYKYTGWKAGHKFLVKMNRHGDIISVAKLF